MSPYTNNSRQNRGRGGSSRHDSGRSDFMTVLLFYVLPFIVVNSIIFILVTAAPKGDLTIGEADNFTTTTMELKIKSLFPIKAMTVTLDGNEVELTKTASKTYTAVLGSNGTVKVSLTAFNGMKNVFSEQVNILDDTPPDIKDSIIEDGVLSFRLEDTQSGVNYDTIYAYDDDTPEILPLSIDRSTGIITFDMQKENLTICVKDQVGNEARVTITPKGENLNPEEAAALASQEAAQDSDAASGESKEDQTGLESAEKLEQSSTRMNPASGILRLRRVALAT